MKLTTNENGERVLYLDRDDVGLPRLAGATRRYLLGVDHAHGRDSHVERLV